MGLQGSILTNERSEKSLKISRVTLGFNQLLLEVFKKVLRIILFICSRTQTSAPFTRNVSLFNLYVRLLGSDLSSDRLAEGHAISKAYLWREDLRIFSRLGWYSVIW